MIAIDSPVTIRYLRYLERLVVFFPIDGYLSVIHSLGILSFTDALVVSNSKLYRPTSQMCACSPSSSSSFNQTKFFSSSLPVFALLLVEKPSIISSLWQTLQFS